MKNPIQAKHEEAIRLENDLFRAMQSAANEAEKSLRFANPSPSQREIQMARHFAELGARHALSSVGK